MTKEVKRPLQDHIQDVSQDLQALTLMERTDRHEPVEAQVMDTEVMKENDKAKDNDKTRDDDKAMEDNKVKK